MSPPTSLLSSTPSPPEGASSSSSQQVYEIIDLDESESADGAEEAEPTATSDLELAPISPSPSSWLFGNGSALSMNVFEPASSNYSQDVESPDFLCPICLEQFNDPTSANCGHTYCRNCILQTIENTPNPRCPKCGTNFDKEKLVPNYTLNDVMARNREKLRETKLKTDLYNEYFNGDSPLNDVTALFQSFDKSMLSVEEMDLLIKMFQRKRDVMAQNDARCKKLLMEEFLSQLLKIKHSKVEYLQTQIRIIDRDLFLVRNGDADKATSFRRMATATGHVPSHSHHDHEIPGPSRSYKRMKLEIDEDKIVNQNQQAPQTPSTSTSTSSQSPSSQQYDIIGFNTDPHLSQEMAHRSVSARKERLYKHFDSLMDIYFETRKPEVFDTRLCDSEFTEDEKAMLSGFGNTLCQITQYHSLKPLATLNYSPDMLSNQNIVSSIEFDKDGEFFAIAGVAKKIKMFDYEQVIGTAGTPFGNGSGNGKGQRLNIHCPTVELELTAKVSCIAWNNYFKNQLASSDYEGVVAVWDVATSTKLRHLHEHEKRVWSVDWSKNGDPRLFASGSDDCKVKLWANNLDKSIATISGSPKANVCTVQFSPRNSHQISFGTADHCVYIYDFRNPKEPLETLFGHKKAVSYVKYCSDDELVSASIDGSLKLWKVFTGNDSPNSTRSFTGHTNVKNFAGLCTDGDFIACGSENNSVYIYHKFLPQPLFSYNFDYHRSMLMNPEVNDAANEFVSAVTWKKNSPVVVAANSQGAIKILELV